MSFCSHCGSASHSSGSAFCTRCGATLNATSARRGWESLHFVAPWIIFVLCVSAVIGALKGLATGFDYLVPYEVVAVVVLVAALFFLMLDRIAKRDPK